MSYDLLRNPQKLQCIFRNQKSECHIVFAISKTWESKKSECCWEQGTYQKTSIPRVSLAVPQPSTHRALHFLALEFRWDPAFAVQYDRRWRDWAHDAYIAEHSNTLCSGVSFESCEVVVTFRCLNFFYILCSFLHLCTNSSK